MQPAVRDPRRTTNPHRFRRAEDSSCPVPFSFTLCPECLARYRALTYDPNARHSPSLIPFDSIVWSDEHTPTETRLPPQHDVCRYSLIRLVSARKLLWRTAEDARDFRLTQRLVFMSKAWKKRGVGARGGAGSDQRPASSEPATVRVAENAPRWSLRGLATTTRRPCTTSTERAAVST